MEIFGLEYARVAAENAEFPAVISEQGEFTHGMFWRFACGIASGLERDGVNENALVAFTSDNLVTVLAMIIATSVRGARLIVAEAAVARAGIGKPSHFYRTAEMKGGKKFQVIDKAWLEMMIRHHEGAIAMALTVKANGSNPDVLALADQVIAAQQGEIGEMETLLASAG